MATKINKKNENIYPSNDELLKSNYKCPYHKIKIQFSGKRKDQPIFYCKRCRTYIEYDKLK